MKQILTIKGVLKDLYAEKSGVEVVGFLLEANDGTTRNHYFNLNRNWKLYEFIYSLYPRVDKDFASNGFAELDLRVLKGYKTRAVLKVCRHKIEHTGDGLEIVRFERPYTAHKSFTSLKL